MRIVCTQYSHAKLRNPCDLIAKRRPRYAMKAKPLDFLVIGAHKAATTSLFHYLRRHPQLFLPSEKEAGFFSNDYWWERGWDAFAYEFFGQTSAKALWGEGNATIHGIPGGAGKNSSSHARRKTGCHTTKPSGSCLLSLPHGSTNTCRKAEF